MAPSAPALLSTRIAWPIAPDTEAPRMRVIVSVAEPAGNGTTMRIGLPGYCASAVPAKSAATAKRNHRFIDSSLAPIIEWPRTEEIPDADRHHRPGPHGRGHGAAAFARRCPRR